MKRLMKKTAYMVKKNSPTILIGAGIVGFVGTVISAVSATKRAEILLEMHNDKMSLLKDDDDASSIYKETAISMAKTYAPTVGLGIASITAIVGSNIILKNRNLALSTSLSAVTSSYNIYRDNVKLRFGEEVDFELKNGLIGEEVTTKDPETGKKVTTKVYKKMGEATWDYTFKFDQNSINFDRGDHNFFFLKRMSDVFTNELAINKYVYLNDVLSALGIPKVSYGQVVGWKWKEDKINRITFGLENYETPHVRAFIEGTSDEYVLHLNCDGYIYDDAKFVGDYIQEDNLKLIEAEEVKDVK